MRKSYVLFCAVAATLMAGAAQAAKPPIAEGESADVNAARDAYATSRRASPYNSNFNSAAARLNAYQDFQSALPNGVTAVNNTSHSEHWQPIGPAPIVGGQTPTYNDTARSPVSGRATSIAIDATDNAVFIGGAQGGVWRSLNNGATWTPLTDYLGSLAVGVITIDPAAHAPNQATIYLGTGEGNFSGDSYYGVGIYKSTDSGRTWSGPYGSSLMTGRSVLTIAVDSTNPNLVLAGTSSGVAGESAITAPAPLQARGIFRSTDGGVTWTKITAGNNPVGKIAQDPNTPARWWAAMSPVADPALGGLLKSEDSGQTWAAVDGLPGNGLPAITSGGQTVRSNITLTTDTPGNAAVVTLYFGTSKGNGNNGTIYKSTDDGANWTHLTAYDYFCYPQCFYDQPIYTEPGAPNVFYSGGGGYEEADVSGLPAGLFTRSDDGGTTHAEKIRSEDDTTALHADMHFIVSWPGQPNRLWVANDGGVWRSDDRGDNWVDVNTNLALTQFSGCDLHPTQFGAALGGTQDNGTDAWVGTTSWGHSDDGDGGFAAIDHTTPTNIAHTYYNQKGTLMGVATAYNGVASTVDDFNAGGFAGTYSGWNNGLILSDNVLFYAPFVLDRNNTSTMYYGTNHLNKAVDFWNQAANTTPSLQIYTQLNGGNAITTAVSPSTYTGAISAIETAPSLLNGDSQIIFVGSDNGRVFRSVDSGATFQEVDAGGPLGLFVSNIIVDPRNPQVVYQSRSGFSGSLPAHNVRKSIDGGTTWNDAASGLPDIPVNGIAFDPAFPNQLWAGTDVGMYLSTDGGASWIPYNDGVPNVAIFDVKSEPLTHTVLACTHGRGAFILNTDAIFVDDFDAD